MQIGVCSWSLQVQSVAELGRILDRLGISVVHIACGDPHHASWEEGDRLPDAARAARFQMTAAMIGFPGEDYTTPQTIQATGGFGPSELRAERLDRLRWALERTRQLGLTVLTGHAGYIPDPRSPERRGFLDTLARAGDLASQAGVTFALETGQEAATLLKLTLDELACPHLGVNFDPANMLLYDMGDPVAAVELLAPYIRRVHAKDARRPTRPGAWGAEEPLGQGQVDLPAFVRALATIGYDGPLCIEREVGDQAQRIADVAHGVGVLRDCLAQLSGRPAERTS